ncbi:hypothetical protein NL676_035205 [Syzygium grande]|nr:hypothetical protein NL676_035205 [Syzygium grande]
MNRTSSVTQRYEASLPGGGGDVVVPVVGAGSFRDPAGLEVGVVEVSLTDACRGFLNIACISGRQSSGDHLFCSNLMMRKLRWMAADVLLTSQACLVDDILGDHLVVEKVDDEEAEMVLIGRILSDKCSSRAA